MIETALYLQVNSETPYRVYPVYGDDVEIAKEREADERYFRESISGSITFVGSDFTTIYATSASRVYTLIVKMRDTTAGTETEVGRATFTKTDCEFDVDNEQCTLKFTTIDRYSKILAGLENAYNLIDLAPAREAITLNKRAILQIYFRGDTKVTNIVGNISYEVDTVSSVTIDGSSVSVEELTDLQLRTYFHFGKLQDNVLYIGFNAEDFLAAHPNAPGKYTLDHTEQEAGILYYVWINPSGYRLRTRLVGESYTGYLHDSNDVGVTYTHEGVTSYVHVSYRVDCSVKRAIAVSGGYTDMEEIGGTYNMQNGLYARLLVDEQFTSDFEKIPSEDICTTNLNYRYCLALANTTFTGYNLVDRVVISVDVQDDPTKWGVNGDGKYFVRPTPMAQGNNVIAIGWNKWIPCSFWFDSAPGLAVLIDDYTTTYTLNDAFSLANTIKALLAEIDSDITFDETEAYSKFLYSAYNPVTGTPNRRLFVTPLTNVKKTYYSTAAKKGDISLANILNMLKVCYQCYWFIDASNRLRIEHVSWFRKGGSYTTPSPDIVVKDLTTLYSPRNGQPWAFGQHTYAYEMGDTIKRYEFEWADSEGEVFNGYPIDITDGYVRDSKTETFAVANFVADIDLITSAPDGLSDDLYALISTNNPASGQKSCLIEWMILPGTDGTIVYAQNLWCSLAFSEMNFWQDNLGGYSESIEGASYTAGGIFKAKIQNDVEFPCTLNEYNSEYNLVVKTGTENAPIRKISLNLSSLMATATLEYDTVNSQGI